MLPLTEIKSGVSSRVFWRHLVIISSADCIAAVKFCINTFEGLLTAEFADLPARVLAGP